MATSIPSTYMHDLKYNHSFTADVDSRDATQSRLLHEPTFRICNIDPITGNSIDNVTNHPWITDGNLTIYFETEDTRQVYLNFPLNHPYLHLPYEVSNDVDRGG